MEMATSKHRLCCICEHKNNEIMSVVFCSECDQAFCTECELQHRFSKPLKDHVTITLEQLNALPEFITEVKTFCDEHGKPLELYCPDHEEPICTMCLAVTHRCCCSITPLHQITKNYNKTGILDEFKLNIKDMGNFIEKAKEDLSGSMSNFKDGLVRCENLFASIRKEFNDYIDGVQAKVLSSLLQSLKKFECEAQDFNEVFLQFEEKIMELDIDLEKTKQSATVLQTFLASPKIERIILETESSIQQFVNNMTLREIEMKSLKSVQPKLKLVEMKIEDTVVVNKTQISVQYFQNKAKHAQLSMEVPKSIEKLELIAEKEIRFKEGDHPCNIVGCAEGPSGEYVFCDFSQNKRLIVVNKSGVFERFIETQARPCCIAFKDENHVAITFPDVLTVEIRKLSNYELVVQKQFPGRCVGVQCNDGFMYIRSKCYIYKLDCKGEVMQTIELKECIRAHLFCLGKSIISSSDEGLSWLDSDGKLFRSYPVNENPAIEGISADKFGNVYLACYRANKIIVISQNGEQQKVLLSDKDGLKLPTGLCYNAVRDKMLIVTSSLGTATFYTINRIS